MKTSQRRKQKRTRPNSTSRRQARLRPRTSSKRQPNRPPPSRARPKPTVPPEPRGAPPAGVYNTARTRGPSTRNLGSGPLGPPQALGCYSQNTSTPAPALVTKATSKVPLSPRAPWDTRRHPSRAPSTPTRPTVTEAPSHLRTSRGVSSSSFNQTSPSSSAPAKATLSHPGRTFLSALHHGNSAILLFNPSSPLTSFPTASNGTETRRQTSIGTKKKSNKSFCLVGLVNHF